MGRHDNTRQNETIVNKKRSDSSRDTKSVGKSYNVLSCLVLSCRIVSYRIVSYNIVSCLVLSCILLSCLPWLVFAVSLSLSVFPQDKTEQDKDKAGQKRQDRTRQDKTKPEQSRQDNTRHDKTTHDKTRQRQQMTKTRKITETDCVMVQPISYWAAMNSPLTCDRQETRQDKDKTRQG